QVARFHCLIVDHVNCSHCPGHARTDGADVSVGLCVIGVFELARVEPPAWSPDENHGDTDRHRYTRNRSFSFCRRLCLCRLRLDPNGAYLSSFFVPLLQLIACVLQLTVFLYLGKLFHLRDAFPPFIAAIPVKFDATPRTELPKGFERSVALAATP